MASTNTVLITGANRGIGKSFVKYYLSQPDHAVIAAVRDPQHTTSTALSGFQVAAGSRLVVVKIDSSSSTDALAAPHELRSKHHITTVDIIIANAGMCKVMSLVGEAKPEDVLEHFQVNVIAVILLFQAFLPLLSKSADPKFITMGSAAGSLGEMDNFPLPNTAYGSSKAALHYVTKKIHCENPGIIAFPLQPGMVRTDMLAAGLASVGQGHQESLAISSDESVAGMVKIIRGATRDKSSGHFLGYDGTIMAW